MDAHRLHCFDIPAPAPIPQISTSSSIHTRGEALAILGVFALVLAVVFAGTYWFNGGTRTQPIERAPIETTPLPGVSETDARITVDRLRDWRAGYEAAVGNGCKVQPLLGSPIGARP